MMSTQQQHGRGAASCDCWVSVHAVCTRWLIVVHTSAIAGETHPLSIIAFQGRDTNHDHDHKLQTVHTVQARGIHYNITMHKHDAACDSKQQH